MARHRPGRTGERTGAVVRPGPSRRVFLRGSAAAIAVPLLPVSSRPAAARSRVVPTGTARPREDWAGEALPPTGPLELEAPEDVRFLLVHHTASGNDYGPDDVPRLIRSFYTMHTGPEKGWPDVAYNFFVDRHGTAWEGRAGSMAGPVMPDATGGSQGFAQLCCFIGDHSTEAPTEAARATMTALLATLADVYGIDTAPGATTSFVSRGSNRWPTGTEVTAATIAGHRDMSATACPGDAAYQLVQEVFPADVTAVRAARAVPPPPPPPPPPPSPQPSAPASPTSATAPTPSPTPAAPAATAASLPAVAAASAEPAGALWSPTALASAGALALGATAGLLAWARLRRNGTSAAPPPRGPSVGPTWRVYEGGAAASTGSAGGGRDPELVGVLHETTADGLLGCLVVSQRPTVGVQEALDGCRAAGRRLIGEEPLQGDPPGGVTAGLWSAARNAAAGPGGHRPPLDVAVLLVRDGSCTIATDDRSMAALVTTQGEVLRPEPADGSAGGLHLATAPAAMIALVVLASPVPASGDAQRTPRLAELSRRLHESVDVRTALAGFEYDFYGATGTDATVVAFVQDGSARPSRQVQEQGSRGQG